MAIAGLLRAGFLAGLLACAAPAFAEWREASTRHFVIYSEQSPKALKDFATRLERYDKAMRVLRGLDDEPLGDANRLTVYVVSSASRVQKLYGSGSSGFGVIGFYIPRASGSLAIVPRSTGATTEFDMNEQIVLFHEYAHHFMMQNYPNAYPMWFIEGFAEFHSTTDVQGDGSVGIGTPAMHRARTLLAPHQLALEKMLAADSKLSPAERDGLYSRGWLLVHYLTLGNDTRKVQLGDYLRRINRGEGDLTAARAAFGDLKVLDRELRVYVGKRLAYWKIAPDKLPIGPIAIRQLSPGEDAVMDLKIRSRRGVTREQAKALLPLMRKAAAPFPNDVAVQTTLAEAEFDANNLAEAEAAADRALAVDPKSVAALLYKGRAKAALAVEAKDFSPARWSEVRKVFVAANRADPDHAEPMILFYTTYLSQGIEPTANAALGLTTALIIAPQDRSLRMMVAGQYLNEGKGKEARAALAPIAFDPHGGAAAKHASAIIALLDKSDAKTALAAWRKQGADESGEAAEEEKK